MTTITRSTPIVKSARMRQMASLLDVPLEDRAELTWNVELPLDERPWQIGLIAGPSGSGKSSIAADLFRKRLVREFRWPREACILDAFPAEMGVQEIVGLLTSVGLGSAPTWLRPYRVLSTGEQFRATVARAIAEAGEGLVAVDEFTSVVDRQVAKVCSHAIQRTIRRRAGAQLVAISCHVDIVDWLQPDWVYQPHLDAWEWRHLQPRPTLELEIRPVDRAVWATFKRHHYLSANLVPGVTCYGGFIAGECVAFAGVAGFPHYSPKAREIRRVRRLVVLPDWQGLGIGTRMEEALAQHYAERGYRFRSVVSHPGMVRYYLRSPRWRCERRPGDAATFAMLGSTRRSRPGLAKHQRDFRNLLTYAFAYVPPPGTVRVDKSS